MRGISTKCTTSRRPQQRRYCAKSSDDHHSPRSFRLASFADTRRVIGAGRRFCRQQGSPRISTRQKTSLIQTYVFDGAAANGAGSMTNGAPFAQYDLRMAARGTGYNAEGKRCGHCNGRGRTSTGRRCTCRGQKSTSHRPTASRQKVRNSTGASPRARPRSVAAENLARRVVISKPAIARQPGELRREAHHALAKQSAVGGLNVRLS